MFQIDELQKKDKLLVNAVVELKKMFVGIDDIIDGVVGNLKSWFLFPELYKRPLIINLFGLTGTGKTSLVNEITRLLGIEQDVFYFNFAEIGECTAWEIEDRITDELSDEYSNRVFVYDEFQYAATIKDGEETDKKSGLKPFWEILDNGSLRKKKNFWDNRSLYNAAYFLSMINDKEPIKLRNGVWINAQECLQHFTSFEVNKFREFLQFDDISNIRQEHPIDPIELEAVSGEYRKGDMLIKRADENVGCEKELPCPEGPFIFERFLWARVIRAVNRFAETKDGGIDLYHRVCQMSVNEIVTMLMDLYEKASKGYTLDFHNSVIFVIANVDEAFTMAFNNDPDMSADAFHEASKNITIVDIKNALHARFRNEQIARLGNIHHIYPSFSSKSFKEIIKRNLKKFCEEVVEVTKLDTSYDNKIVGLIYKEAVFPTHGTRPIFSTLADIVKAKVADVVLDIYESNIQASSLTFSAAGDKTVVIVRDKNGNEVKRLSYNNKLRVEPLRKVSEDKSQVITALHESGHFIVYAALCGKIPEKVMSSTADSKTQGFMIPDKEEERNDKTFREIKNMISVALAGYVAERMLLNEEDMTAGASSDIIKATEIASRMMRRWGYDYPMATTFIVGDSSDKALVLDQRQSVADEIKELIDECYMKAKKVLEASKDALKESTKYLSENAVMPKRKMEAIVRMIPEEVKEHVINAEDILQKLENI